MNMSDNGVMRFLLFTETLESKIQVNSFDLHFVIIIIHYIMQENQDHHLSKGQAYTFSLKAIHKEKRSNLNATLSLCQGKQNKNTKTKAECLNYEGPILNRDKCHATPTFILPSQKMDYTRSTQAIVWQHEKRAKESQEEIDQLLVPKPKSKTMYCNVCRQHYDEYLDHIKSQSHKANIRKSEFNGHILELQRKMKNNSTKDFSQPKTAHTSKQQIEESVQIVGVLGRKKVKTDSQVQLSLQSHPFYTNQNYNSYPFEFNLLSLVQYQSFYNPSFNMNLRSFFEGTCSYPLFRPINSFLQQQQMTYPIFCVPVQPLFAVNAADASKKQA